MLDHGCDLPVFATKIKSFNNLETETEAEEKPQQSEINEQEETAMEN